MIRVHLLAVEAAVTVEIGLRLRATIGTAHRDGRGSACACLNYRAEQDHAAASLENDVSSCSCSVRASPDSLKEMGAAACSCDDRSPRTQCYPEAVAEEVFADAAAVARSLDAPYPLEAATSLGAAVASLATCCNRRRVRRVSDDQSGSWGRNDWAPGAGPQPEAFYTRDYPCSKYRQIQKLYFRFS